MTPEMGGAVSGGRNNPDSHTEAPGADSRGLALSPAGTIYGTETAFDSTSPDSQVRHSYDADEYGEGVTSRLEEFFEPSAGCSPRVSSTCDVR